MTVQRQMTRDELIRKMVYFRNKAITWKQAAKKWRGWAMAWHEGLLEWQDEALKEQALAAKRLELLRRVDNQRGLNYTDCLFCGHRFGNPHAPDCELAAELGEQPADTGEGVA